MRLHRNIAAQCQRAVETGTFPGCVVGTVRADKEEVYCAGRLTYDADAPAVTGETIYDLASVTKTVPTATLALQLVGEERLSLDDKLIEYLPEYRTAHRDLVTVQHLLTYTLGNRLALSTLCDRTPDEMFEAVCTEESDPPGARFSYSNTPALLLGIVVERVLGVPLDAAARAWIFEPLGMQNATFRPQGAAPTEEGVQDIVHDESARLFARAGRAVGHAGLFSSVSDLLVFARHVLASDTSVITKNYIEPLGQSVGLGWELNQSWMGDRRSPRTIGKTGFTGTCIVCDPERRYAVIILSNRTYPRRPADASAITAFRRTVCDIVFQS